jgi:DHA2 family multidrug resistance protein-like MFS transporter
MALLLIAGPRLLPEYKNPDAGRIDLASAALSLVAVISVIYGLKEIAQDGFATSAALAIVGGIAVGTTFVRRQSRLADPLLDLKMFRIPAFSVSVVTNALGGFIAFGTFLYFAQYMQLVLGLSPLVAGLWTLPSSIAVIVSSNLAPVVLRRVRPAYAAAASLATSAAGLTMLSLVGGTTGVALPVLGSIVFSVGLGPVFILTTDLIMGSAPAERAGAASAISETGAEFGGALGIAVLGSIGTAIYRSGVVDAVPEGVPSAAADAARDTLGGALAAVQQLPASVGGDLLETARAAFTQGLQVASATGAVIAIAVAILVASRLRHIPRGGAAGGEDVASEEGRALTLEPVSAEC